jgi:hypothetical protein
MQTTTHQIRPSRQVLLQECPLPGSAPFEIYGATARACEASEDYLFQGFRYLLDAERDVFVREDVNAWIASRKQVD